MLSIQNHDYRNLFDENGPFHAFPLLNDCNWRLNFDPTVAQKGQIGQARGEALKNSGKALDQNGLQQLALRYVSRYATTRGKLTAYLNRKLREKGWHDEKRPEIAPLVERFVDLGYIDDAQYAKNRAIALINKGYGKRRVSQALFQARIAQEDGQRALELSEEMKWDAALTFARKKKIGPFATEQQPRDKCNKQLQAFLRAGHSYDTASRFVFAKPGEDVDDCD